MQNKNSTTFYYKKETKTKRGYDKKTYSKLMLNTVKVMGNSTSIYTYWALSSKKWPMLTHVRNMNEVKFNLKLIKIQVRVNW
jgi:hypothetical protein